MGWGGGLTFPLGVSVETPPGVCLAHGPLWGGTLGTGDPGPRRARARAAAELWGVRGEIRVPWVLAGSPQAHRGGWDPGCGLLPLQPSCPQEARRCRPALPPRAVPPARPGTVLQGLPAQSPSEPAREVGLGDGGSSHCPRADPADASCGHFLDSHLGAPLGHDKYPRQLGAGAGGPHVHRGPSTEASAEKGKQGGSPSSPCQRWHAGDPSGVGEGAVLCRRRPDGLQAVVEPSAWRMPRPSQPPESLSLSPRPA